MQTNGELLGAATSPTSPGGRGLGQRYTVQDAAQILGTTVDGVRSRIRRGTLNSMKVSGQVYVLLDPDPSGLAPTGPDWSGDGEVRHPVDRDAALEAKDETIAELRDRVGQLTRILETRDRELEARTEEIRRRDHIIAGLVERLPPQLEAPDSPAPRKSPQAPAEEAEGTYTQSTGAAPQEGSERRSWWRRLLWG